MTSLTDRIASSTARKLVGILRSLAMALVAAGVVLAAFLAIGWGLKHTAASEAEINTLTVLADEILDPSYSEDDRFAIIVDQEITDTFSQSPLLESMVEAGDLPPLVERLPANPVVMRGVEGIGRYGGTWLRLANAASDINVVTNRLSGVGLLRWSPLGEPILPLLAESFDASPDDRVFTFRLRPGVKWSDGQPFTVADIMYRWEHELLDESLGGEPPTWAVNGENAPVFEQLDEFTLRISFTQPNPIFPSIMATFSYSLCNSPRHYLEPYHPVRGDLELIERDMQAFGLPSARSLYSYIKQVTNPQHPRLWPWVYTSHQPDPPFVLVRNPYYFAVDMRGQQLPYIDSLHFEIMPGDQFPLAVSTGKASMQLRGIEFSDVVDYLTRAQEGQIDVRSWYSATRAMWVLNPNLNRRVTAHEPASQWKSEYLGDRRFRQALSLALDRQQIIDAEYKGYGQPSQVAPGQQSSFDVPGLSQAFVEHDPVRAERLLDELGFKRSGPGQMRCAPDGTPLVFFIDYTAYTGRGPADFVITDWAKIGVHAIARERARALFYTQLRGLNFDFAVWTSESDHDPLLSPRSFVPAEGAFWAIGWANWIEAGGDTNGDWTGPQPPADHPVREAMRLYRLARSSQDQAQQVEYFRRLGDIVAQELWTISIATHPPQLVVKDPDMRNVPRHALSGWAYLSPSNAGIETYYFASPKQSAGAESQTIQMLRQGEPRPGRTATADEASGFSIGHWMVPLFWTGGATLILLVALRHPFIGRRLLVMVPTLAVMSVLVFTIIQLPPGDFLLARLMELEEQGDPSAQQQIRDMREMYHYDESVVSRYSRWVGLHWFTTFSSSDTGLLQGDLGRSMATGQRVNDIVGDRILLTIAISAGSILLTWLIAIPIGIFSAVKQYSWGDYVVTLIGFIGMSMPNFLLALVLMSLAGVSGLFSAEYASQPDWSWGKFGDLLGHIWVPVVVVGIAGTAGMIRVMRANLLDELRKPYVVTARAKGVKPIKLLVKYPVRLAISPFVSGLGNLLPQLVSGGAIVAIVLALPTVGPLLLDSLMQEDMYMAGSLLLVMSLLGVVGTLLSDLLLLAIDPRIRMERRK